MRTYNSQFSLENKSPPRDGIVRLKPDGTRWRTGGEVKGKLANGVGSQYSHTPSERSVSSITTADAHNSAASSRLNWRPRRFKWTRLFRRKTKSGFCACAIRFQTRYTSQSGCQNIILLSTNSIFHHLTHKSPPTITTLTHINLAQFIFLRSILSNFFL